MKNRKLSGLSARAIVVGAQRFSLDDTQPAVGVFVDDPFVFDQAGTMDDAIDAAVTRVD